VIEPVKYIPCLACGQLMVRRQFRRGTRMSGVIVDSCRDHGVWLDHDELERIVAFLQAQEPGGVTREPVDGDFARERARSTNGPGARALGAEIEESKAWWILGIGALIVRALSAELS